MREIRLFSSPTENFNVDIMIFSAKTVVARSDPYSTKQHIHDALRDIVRFAIVLERRLYTAKPFRHDVTLGLRSHR